MIKDLQNFLDNIQPQPERNLNDHVVLIDGLNTLIRSFIMVKKMNPVGNHVGGTVGFLRSLGYLNRILDPTRVVCIFDGKGGSMNRRNMNADYKEHRKHVKLTHWGAYDTKEEETAALVDQLIRLQDYLDCLPVQQIVMEKLEADDIIAYIAKGLSGKSKKVTIVSTDGDFFQLIDPTIQVYSPIRKELFTEENIGNVINVHPHNYNLVKALSGDPADGLHGIPGLGPKSVVKHFPRLVDDPTVGLDYIYEIAKNKLDDKKVLKIFPKIIDSWNDLERDYKIVNLHETVLSDQEKESVIDQLKHPIPKLKKHDFLSLLEIDKIEGITKNTENWLSGFRNLSKFSQ